MDPEIEDRSINIVPIVVVLPVLVLLVALAVGVGNVADAVLNGVVTGNVTGVVDADTGTHGHRVSLQAGH